VRKISKPIKILLITLAIILLAAAGLAAYLFFYSPALLEAQLREQFGDAFFEEFNDNPPVVELEPETYQDIINKYEPRFHVLQERAIERLEELYQAALTEYREQRRKGKVDRFQLTNKYIQAGRLLENRVDDSFYDLLGRMENELENRDYPTDIIKEIEETYEKMKQDKKEELFERLREEVNV